MSMTPQEFVALMSQLNTQEKAFSLGTIQSGYSSGRPRVLFDGESVTSSKQYSYLSSYAPASNDRVLLANISGTYVILGKIV
ncbi:hypothetical protein [Priestia megaterium]|uniref:hypothetical protein n=1 Tax=Priestia megaterium TaxID=1404 RepID=UPI001C54ED54|nr:hypothetical protein [Priestia megaterium]